MLFENYSINEIVEMFFDYKNSRIVEEEQIHPERKRNNKEESE